MWRAPNCEQIMTVLVISYYYHSTTRNSLVFGEFLRRKRDKSVFAHTMGSTTRLGGRNMRIRILILSPLAALSSLFFWLSNSLDEPLQLDRITIRLLNFFTPTHHSLRFGSRQNLGNHLKLTVFWSHIV